MIIARIHNGLGNQMFQYALGRYLAHKHQTELVLDIQERNDPANHRTFELGIFEVQGRLATGADMPRSLCIPKGSIRRQAYKLCRLVHKSDAVSIVIEPHFHFDRSILDTPDNAYLDGYWQSEKYFKEIESIIRREFTLKSTLAGKNLEIARQIEDTLSVAVHVRRGDYVANASLYEKHGVCSLEYYHRAFDYILSKYTNPAFYIFSDDIDWAKNHIQIDSPIFFLNHNSGAGSHEDMRLMRLCKHNIIANSTFSWWAAWLNSNTDKTVIAPQSWFNDPYLDTVDLIPNGWIKL